MKDEGFYKVMVLVFITNAWICTWVRPFKINIRKAGMMCSSPGQSQASFLPHSGQKSTLLVPLLWECNQIQSSTRTSFRVNESPKSGIMGERGRQDRSIPGPLSLVVPLPLLYLPVLLIQQRHTLYTRLSHSGLWRQRLSGPILSSSQPILQATPAEGSVPSLPVGVSACRASSPLKPPSSAKALLCHNPWT